ncbi:hypothetical protein [Succinimonas amylolytica]|nr:hypothetical protein [Succinimonas amylolytica]
MKDSKKLIVRFTPHGSGDQNATFDLGGIEKVVENIASSCHWKK